MKTRFISYMVMAVVFASGFSAVAQAKKPIIIISKDKAPITTEQRK